MQREICARAPDPRNWRALLANYARAAPAQSLPRRVPIGDELPHGHPIVQPDYQSADTQTLLAVMAEERKVHESHIATAANG